MVTTADRMNVITEREMQIYKLARAEGGPEGLSIEEAAQKLGIKKPTMQVQLSALRKKLKAKGKKMPEFRKLAKGGGSNSVDLDEFLEDIENSEDEEG